MRIKTSSQFMRFCANSLPALPHIGRKHLNGVGLKRDTTHKDTHDFDVKINSPSEKYFAVGTSIIPGSPKLPGITRCFSCAFKIFVEKAVKLKAANNSAPKSFFALGAPSTVPI